MSKFDTLRTKYLQSKEIADERETRFFVLVEEVLTGCEIVNVGIEGVWIIGDTVEIEYGWSCRGCFNSKTITLPKYLFDAQVPIEAARTYWQQVLKTRSDAAREEKIRQIARLQAELIK